MPIHAPFLKYFLEVARCGSMRLAASRLFISSSAINRQILKIEDELGTRLFERVPGGMKLTPSGQLLLEHVERTLADAERCIAAIGALGADDGQPITIAGQESIIGEFLSPVLVDFHIACPGSCSAFRAAGGHELNDLLKNAEADVAVAFDSPVEEGVEHTASRELAVGAIVSPEHPLATATSVTLAECAAFPLILPDASWPLRRRLDQMILELVTPPSVISTSNSVEFLRTMIDRRLGVGFQTAMGLEGSLKLGLLVQVPLHDTEPVRQRLTVCVSAGIARSEPFEVLLALLEARLGDYADEWSRCRFGTGQ